MSLSGCWNSWRREHMDDTLKCSCWDMNQDPLCCEATPLTATVPPCFRACVLPKPFISRHHVMCVWPLFLLCIIDDHSSFSVSFYYILQRPAGAGVSVGAWAYVVGGQAVLWQCSTCTKRLKYLNLCVFWVTLGEVSKLPGKKKWQVNIWSKQYVRFNVPCSHSVLLSSCEWALCCLLTLKTKTKNREKHCVPMWAWIGEQVNRNVKIVCSSRFVTSKLNFCSSLKSK